MSTKITSASSSSPDDHPNALDPVKIVCIGVATDSNHRGYKAYIASAEKYDIDIRVVGLGKKWQGWKWRTEQYVKTLSTFQSDTTVVITDTYDVLFNGTMSTVYDTYMKLVQNDTSKVVFGMEKWNGPQTYGDVNQDGTLPNISAGCCCGRADVLHTVWSSILNTYDTIGSLDDQYTLGYLVTHDQNIKSRIVFDGNSDLIVNMTYFYSRKVRSVKSIHSPIVHFPGGFKWSGKKVWLHNSMLKALHQETYHGLEYKFDYIDTSIFGGLFILCILMILIYKYLNNKQ
jgi:hypothetical protein